MQIGILKRNTPGVSQSWQRRSTILSCPSSCAEEALREGGYEADLDQQANHGLDGCERRDGVAEAFEGLEEAAPVKATHAQNQCLIPGQRREL